MNGDLPSRVCWGYVGWSESELTDCSLVVENLAGSGRAAVRLVTILAWLASYGHFRVT